MIQTINRIDMYTKQVIGIYFVYVPNQLQNMNAESHTMSYYTARQLAKLDFEDTMGLDGLEEVVRE